MPSTATSPHRSAILSSFIAALLVLAPSAAPAATRSKADNTSALNLAASWDTLPGTGDVALWSSVVTAPNSTVLGADLGWAGIKVVAPGGPVTLGAGNTLTIGPSGIDLSSATQNLTLNCGLVLQGQQSWSAAAGRSLNIAGTFTHSGATIDFTNFNASATLGTLANDPSGILGPWATTTVNGTTFNYAKCTAGVIAAATQTGGTAGTLANVTNPAVNYSFGPAPTLTAAISANSLRFNGGTATLANAGYSATLNGLMHAGTGTLTISGSGSLVIGATRELVIVANTQSTSISSVIANNSAGASSLTYAGSGVLTLSALNTYSGGTTVNSGTLSPYGNGTGSTRAYLGTGTVTMSNGTTLKPTDVSGQPVDMNNAFYLAAGTVSVSIPFSGATDMRLRGAISGPGGLAIGGGTRGLALYSANTFSGGIVLNDGNRLLINSASSLGSGTLSLGNASAGSLETLADLSVSQLTNTIDLTSGRVLAVSTASGGLNLAGTIQNSGGLTKNGANTLTLSGVNTYTGTTTVSAGILALASNLSLGQGPLVVASGAKLALNYTGGRRVTSLSLGGTVQTAAGTTYGSSTSTASVKNDTYFSGNGILTVKPAGAVTTTVLALSSGSNPAAVGSSLTFRATLSGSSPGGNVTFYDGATLIGSSALNGSFQASVTTSSLASGAHSITAQYEGDLNNEPSGSASMAILVAYPADILTFSFPGLSAVTLSVSSISVTVPYATDVTALSPIYTTFPGSTCVPASGSAQNFSNPVHYVVTGADTSTKDYTVTVNKTAAATAKDILTFSFPGLPVPTIGTNTITLSVPYGTPVTALSPTYTVSPLASGNLLSGSTQNFSNPVTYTISAEDGSTKAYTVTVTILPRSSAKDVLTFVFPGLSATTIGSNTVTLTVPYATDVTALAPTYTVSALASGSPISGTAQNFSNPVSYTITAEDGSTKIYTVTVAKAAASALKSLLTCSFGSLGAATLTSTTWNISVAPNQPLTALAPTFTFSPFATLNPPSGSVQNFTNPVIYTVTAQDGSTQAYTVAVQSYQTWSYSGSLFILTTPDGANLAASASETNFPLLVRLNSGNFTFSQAQSDGRDIRFATAAGVVLSYQIEQWDAVNGTAAVWVKIPSVTGNARQEIKMYWGKAGVTSESSGTAVFNIANGFVSVLHMNETVSDAVGSVTPSDTGTTLSNGMIGKGRNFTAGKGINCGTNITNFPTGTNSNSSEAWIRPTAANTTVMGWGIEQGSGKIVMQLASPPHINMDCYFGGGNVAGASTLALSQWMHVAHTFKNGEARVYVNGVLDGISSGGSMNIPSPARMYIGGWYDNYTFTGDMDEVRISSVTRSPDWIKLEYENQKPLQTLLGNLVQAGSTFSATPGSVTLNEGTSTTLSAQAGGAQKVYWSLIRNGVETVLATDQFTCNVSAGRVTGNQSFVIRFKGVYPAGNQTVDIPVTVTDTIPDPVFTLTASTSQWDGRQTMTVTPVISNLPALQAAGVANLNYTWNVAGVAVAKQITAGTPAVPGTLTLTRSQGSGPMTVSLVLDNGGALVSSSTTVTVQEPASDAWLQRTPGATEKPVSGQFFARDPSGYGTIYYNGTQSGSPASVYLKVYTTDTGTDVPYGIIYRQTLGTGGSYAFSAAILGGKTTYKVVYGTTSSGGVDTIVNTVANLVCGDAYILEGQSNAVATDSLPGDATNSPWIRTYGQTTAAWGNAVRNGSDFWIGYWGFDLALTLSATYNMPICIINGAVGGTRIDQHQPNPADHTQPGSLYSIYATLLNRVAGATLTYGIRGVFWHQGENNSAAAAPTGDWDYKSYQQYFVDMSAAWKQDYPNIQRYIIYQVAPNPCSMGGKESSDMLREVQRTLPLLYSKMTLLSTLGLPNYLGCHYSAAGYQGIADMTAPLVQRDFYGATPSAAVTAPTLQRAYFTTSARNEIALVFDQNISWNSASTVNFYLDRVGGKVTAGSATGKVVKLTLNGSSTSQSIDYVVDQYWSWSATDLLTGSNALYALSFYGVPIAPPMPGALTATAGNNQVALSWSASVGASSYNVKRSTANGGPYTVIGSAAGSTFTDSTAANGTTFYYVVSATSNVSSPATAMSSTSAEGPDSNQTTATPNSPYAIWAANPAQGLTAGVNDAPMADPDHDGIPNLLEFVLGGNPTVASRTILPMLTSAGGVWSFEYDRSHLSLPPATLQVVEYGSDLAGWTDVTIPVTSGGGVTITPGALSDHVNVIVPTPGDKSFVRLKVTQP